MPRAVRKPPEFISQSVKEDFDAMPQCDLATSSAQDFMRLVAEIEPAITRPRLSLGPIALQISGIRIPDVTYQVDSGQRELNIIDGPGTALRARWGMDLSADTNRRRLAWLEFTKRYVIHTQFRELSASISYRPDIAKSRQVEASYYNPSDTANDWSVLLVDTKMYHTEGQRLDYEEKDSLLTSGDPRTCFAELAGQAAYRLLQAEEFVANHQMRSEMPLSERQKALLARQEFSPPLTDKSGMNLDVNYDGLAVIQAGPATHD